LPATVIAWPSSWWTPASTGQSCGLVAFRIDCTKDVRNWSRRTAVARDGDVIDNLGGAGPLPDPFVVCDVGTDGYGPSS